MEHVTIALGHFWQYFAIGKMFPLKTLISQTLLFDNVEIFPNECFSIRLTYFPSILFFSSYILPLLAQLYSLDGPFF